MGKPAPFYNDHLSTVTMTSPSQCVIVARFHCSLNVPIWIGCFIVYIEECCMILSVHASVPRIHGGPPFTIMLHPKVSVPRIHGGPPFTIMLHPKVRVPRINIAPPPHDHITSLSHSVSRIHVNPSLTYYIPQAQCIKDPC